MLLYCRVHSALAREFAPDILYHLRPCRRPASLYRLHPCRRPLITRIALSDLQGWRKCIRIIGNNPCHLRSQHVETGLGFLFCQHQLQAVSRALGRISKIARPLNDFVEKHDIDRRQGTFNCIKICTQPDLDFISLMFDGV